MPGSGWKSVASPAGAAEPDHSGAARHHAVLGVVATDLLVHGLDHRVRAHVAGRLAQRLVQHLDRGVAVDLLDGGHFARHPVEGRLVELPLGIGLLGLAFRTVQVADDLGARDQVAGRAGAPGAAGQNTDGRSDGYHDGKPAEAGTRSRLQDCEHALSWTLAAPPGRRKPPAYPTTAIRHFLGE